VTADYPRPPLVPRGPELPTLPLDTPVPLEWLGGWTAPPDPAVAGRGAGAEGAGALERGWTFDRRGALGDGAVLATGAVLAGAASVEFATLDPDARAVETGPCDRGRARPDDAARAWPRPPCLARAEEDAARTWRLTGFADSAIGRKARLGTTGIATDRATAGRAAFTAGASLCGAFDDGPSAIPPTANAPPKATTPRPRASAILDAIWAAGCHVLPGRAQAITEASSIRAGTRFDVGLRTIMVTARLTA